MKWFLLTLAIGLAASDKLDRTYLPPPGAQFAGGILGTHDAPLEPPHIHLGPRPVIRGHEGSQPSVGLNGELMNFGDKIPQISISNYTKKVPVTTTSIAFSQTTTYPTIEDFETTPLSPINSVTGLPIHLQHPHGQSQGQQNIYNLPSSSQNQAPTYGTNIQPGFAPPGSTLTPINYGRSRVITPGGARKISGSVYSSQNQGQFQYPGGQINTEQQGVLSSGAPNNQLSAQYSEQIEVSPGSDVQISGGSQGLLQYPEKNVVSPGRGIQIPSGSQGFVNYSGQTGLQGFIPSTESPINLQAGGNQYGMNYEGSQGSDSQGTYTGQPINAQNQEPFNIGEIPSQNPTGNQNFGPSVPTGSENVYHPGSTPSTIPSAYYNSVFSTTPLPGVSASAYSSVRPVFHPERPQAAADRNAVILNYENIRTPNGYSYSFDTSNGIHADESGIVDNGTKAQGAYSYIGDDGKIYSVIYTADENGFQPRGDHLPTPPPIPEEIQKIIEQAARDKAAGIVHDGFYDEDKYGDKRYQGIVNGRRPQNQDANRFGNKQYNGAQEDLIKPIAGIKDVEYDDDQLNNEFLITGMKKVSSGKSPTKRPSNQINDKNNAQKFSEQTRKILGDGVSPTGDFDETGIAIVEEGINQLDNDSTRKQGSSGRRPISNEDNLPFDEAENTNKKKLHGSKSRGPSDHHLTSSDVKDITVTKYPGSDIDIAAHKYSETEGDRFNDSEGQDIDFGNPNITDDLDENIKASFDRVTGVPIAGNKKQIARQRIKANQRPGSTGNRFIQNKTSKPQGETFTQKNTKTPSISDYIKNAAYQPISNQKVTQQDDQQPNSEFEQNTFPTRFSSQEVSSTMKPDQRRTEYIKDKTRKPFITPNVYNQNNRNSQSTSNAYNQNNNNSQSTTRKPFMTIGVTSPADNSYTDYDVGDDYTTDQDVIDDRIDSTGNLDNKSGITSHPYQLPETTQKPQYLPVGQRTRVNQKGIVAPGYSTEPSVTVSPGYTNELTTSMPFYNSRFGSVETLRRMKPQQREPSTTVLDFNTVVGNPVTSQFSSETRPSGYKYQTTGPVSKYSSANVGSGYPVTSSFSSIGSTTPGVLTPQDYVTATYRPSHGYSSTTTVPSTSKYIQGSASQIPSGTPGLLQTLQNETSHTGYHYGPPKSKYSSTGPFNSDRTGTSFFTPTENSGVYPTSPTGTYQTTYQQGPNAFLSTTSTPGRQDTFIPSQPGNTEPESSPFGTYQHNFQNGPSTPNYTTVVPSTHPGSPGMQETTGKVYGPSSPTYSTTETPSNIVMTPGPYVPSGTTVPSQSYPTNYRPVVDGFGRPIITEQGGLQSAQDLTRPGSNARPNFGGSDQSTTYPGAYDQAKIIGEDFSGPKQPQRFDPKTGYHY